jgi:type IV pilus assembly protein PilN
MPDGTYLTSIKETGTKLKFEGIAQSSTRVSTLMRNISASQWLRNPELEVVETAKDSTGGSHFVLDATQVSVATDDDSSSSAPKRPVRTSSGSNK